VLSLGPLAFASPWVLLALGLLPIVYWLIRVTPPAPRRVDFPAVRLLMRLPRPEDAPAHTPWWLLLMRLLLAALVIVALARPVLNPAAPLTGGGPLVLVIDDGWSAAPQWDATRRHAFDLVERAERDGRDVVIATTAAAGTSAPAPARALRPADARAALQALQPKPWAGDRGRALAALAGLDLSGGDVRWLSDGIAAGDVDQGLARRIAAFGPVSLSEPSAEAAAMAVLPPRAEPGALVVPVTRADVAGAAEVEVVASGGGRALASAIARFEPGAVNAEARVELPSEVRNGIDRVALGAQASAGGTFLMDERWRRRPVGLVSGDAAEAAQPLLSDVFYLNRALAPFADVRLGRVGEILARPVALIALADVGQIVGPDRDALAKWLDQGGVLVRFAGPRMAAQTDDLIPVPLREGGRALGGALTWEQPQPLAAFPSGSPFAGLAIAPDVTVSRQVLAEPTPDLGEKTWARLADGTPLVTADRRGKGWLVLVHTTANAEWSNFALSGLYVDVLRRLVELSAGIAGTEGSAPLPPWSLMDGFGRLGAPGPSALAVPPGTFADLRPGPEHPPGFYGDATARHALNVTRADTTLARIGQLDGIARREGPSAEGEHDLMPALLAAALAIALLDTLVGLVLRGHLDRRRAAAAMLAAALLLPLGPPRSAQAQTTEQAGTAAVLDAVTRIHLAYVVTGDGSADEMSKAGLDGLGAVLRQRTAVETGDAVGVDPETDDLSFYPLLYWPMSTGQKPLTPQALARVDAYMKTGGTILFDTRDAERGFAGTGGGPGTAVLRDILGRLDVPPLVPVPPEHVLTKSFYLMQAFPGRYAGGTVWVEAPAAGANDGVSSLVIGGNDWASAWAVDQGGRPLAALSPGEPQQREWAYRFGVNLVMYALTGNYKADQVHVPALLERLGQ
jgi:hypothetical protein